MSDSYTARPSRRLAALITVVVITFTGAVTGCGTGAGKDTETITIGRPPVGLDNLLLDLAIKKGYFDDEGIDIKTKLLHGDASTIPALSSGSIQFGVATSTPTFIAMKKKAKVQIVAPMAYYTEQIVMRKAIAKKLDVSAEASVAKRMKALKGLRLGVLDLGGGLIYQLRAALAAYGLSRNDVKLVAVNPYTAMVSAMERGDVDAIAPTTPYGTYVDDKGTGVMVADIWNGDVKSMVGTPFQLMSVNTTWASSHQGAVKKVRAAIGKAMAYVHKDPKGAAAFEAAQLKNMKKQVVVDAIGSGQGYPKSPALNKRMFDAMQSFNATSGQKTKAVTLEQAFWSGAKD